MATIGYGCVAVVADRLLSCFPESSKEWPIWIRHPMRPDRAIDSQPDMLVVEPASARWMVAMAIVPFDKLIKMGMLRGKR